MKVLQKFVVTLLLCIMLVSRLFSQIGEKELINALRSTVYIAAAKTIKINGQDTTIYWSGSGSVLSPKGWILTNHHVAFFQDPTDSQWYYPDWLAIYYNESSDQLPIHLFYADVKDYLHYVPFAVDFALLKCAYDNTTLPIPEDRNIFTHYFTIGDSDKDVQVGYWIATIGFPYVSLGTVNYSPGVVENIQSTDPPHRIRKWIGTTATISPGNSGGAAINQEGKLIGVPTWTIKEMHGYLLPINHVRGMLAKWVPETELGAPVSGRIVDAETGEGVIGATIIVLRPGVKCAEVTPENIEEAHYLWVSSAIEGKFHLPIMLTKGKKYGLIIEAAGYERKNVDACFDIQNNKPWSKTIEIVRQH